MQTEQGDSGGTEQGGTGTAHPEPLRGAQGEAGDIPRAGGSGHAGLGLTGTQPSCQEGDTWQR